MTTATTTIILSSGNVIETELAPDDVIAKFTDNNGKIKNEFLEFGINYINPSQVSALVYGEKENRLTEEQLKAAVEIRKKL